MSVFGFGGGDWWPRAPSLSATTAGSRSRASSRSCGSCRAPTRCTAAWWPPRVSGRPDVFVAIDFPDFNFTLGKALHRLGIPVVYYISPQLWAWRPGRHATMKRFVDRGARRSSPSRRPSTSGPACRGVRRAPPGGPRPADGAPLTFLPRWASSAARPPWPCCRAAGTTNCTRSCRYRRGVSDGRRPRAARAVRRRARAGLDDHLFDRPGGPAASGVWVWPWSSTEPTTCWPRPTR